MELTGNVHLSAGTAADIQAVLALLRVAGIETDGNPDLSIEEFKSFGIDDARELRERAALKPAGARRVFLIALSSITAEAQNALLKTLEEPSGDALFIILHPAPQTLLPTLRSRAQMLALASSSDAPLSVDPRTFLKAAAQKRLDMLKPLLEKGDDDRRDFGQIFAFLAGLERELAVAKAADREGIAAIYRARGYLSDRGALVKPLLEHVALIVHVDS